jgi:hypothetical protein
VTPERVYAVIYYCAEVMGIRQFVVDSMMKVIADEDDYNGQKRFTDRLQGIARELTQNGHPVHIHLITHAKKTGDESKRPGKQDNRGSGTIVDQTDNFAVVFRLPEKKEGDTGPDHMVYLDKQRNASDGFEGTSPCGLTSARSSSTKTALRPSSRGSMSKDELRAAMPVTLPQSWTSTATCSGRWSTPRRTEK